MKPEEKQRLKEIFGENDDFIAFSNQVYVEYDAEGESTWDKLADDWESEEEVYADLISSLKKCVKDDDEGKQENVCDLENRENLPIDYIYTVESIEKQLEDMLAESRDHIVIDKLHSMLFKRKYPGYFVLTRTEENESEITLSLSYCNQGEEQQIEEEYLIKQNIASSAHHLFFELLRAEQSIIQSGDYGPMNSEIEAGVETSIFQTEEEQNTLTGSLHCSYKTGNEYVYDVDVMCCGAGVYYATINLFNFNEKLMKYFGYPIKMNYSSEYDEHIEIGICEKIAELEINFFDYLYGKKRNYTDRFSLGEKKSFKQLANNLIDSITQIFSQKISVVEKCDQFKRTLREYMRPLSDIVGYKYEFKSCSMAELLGDTIEYVPYRDARGRIIKTYPYMFNFFDEALICYDSSLFTTSFGFGESSCSDELLLDELGFLYSDFPYIHDVVGRSLGYLSTLLNRSLYNKIIDFCSIFTRGSEKILTDSYNKYISEKMDEIDDNEIISSCRPPYFSYDGYVFEEITSCLLDFDIWQNDVKLEISYDHEVNWSLKGGYADSGFNISEMTLLYCQNYKWERFLSYTQDFLADAS